MLEVAQLVRDFTPLAGTSNSFLSSQCTPQSVGGRLLASVVPGQRRAKSGSRSPPRSTEPGESGVRPGICTPKEHPSLTPAHSPPPQCLLPWFPGRLRTCCSPTWGSAMWGSPPVDSLPMPSFSPWCRAVPKALGEVM